MISRGGREKKALKCCQIEEQWRDKELVSLPGVGRIVGKEEER